MNLTASTNHTNLTNSSEYNSHTAQIIRLNKGTKNFTQFLNETIEFIQKNCKPSVLTIFMYMVKCASRNKDYKFCVDNIRKNTNLGRNTVYEGLKTLIGFGFIYQYQIREFHGHYGPSIYKISQTQCYKNNGIPVKKSAQTIDNNTPTVYPRYTENRDTVTYSSNNITTNYFSEQNQLSSNPVPKSTPKTPEQKNISAEKIQRIQDEDVNENRVHPTINADNNSVENDNQIKKSNENRTLFRYDEQLAALEANKSLSYTKPVDTKPVSSDNHAIDINPTKYPQKNVFRNVVTPGIRMVPGNQSNNKLAKQVFQKIPDELMNRLTIDQKYKMWDIMKPYLSPDIGIINDVADRLIHAILNAKERNGQPPNIAGLYYKSLEMRFDIEKQMQKQDILNQRIPIHKPAVPQTPEERAEVTQLIRKEKLSERLKRNKSAANTVFPEYQKSERLRGYISLSENEKSAIERNIQRT